MPTSARRKGDFMLETIKALTTEYDMLPRGGTVLCAVSGLSLIHI